MGLHQPARQDCRVDRPEGESVILGALLLAQERNGKLTYAGEVGTGFLNALLKSLLGKIKAIEVDECPLDVPMKKEKDFHWVSPKYSAQFNMWSSPRIVM